MIRFHASRSRFETFQRCPRRGFLNYHLGGKGIARKGRNIHLSTGIFSHKGIEKVLRWVKANDNQIIPSELLDDLIVETVKEYQVYVFPEKQFAKAGGGFDLVDEMADPWSGEAREFNDFEWAKVQEYTLGEQSALVEAFVRVFVLKVLPKILEESKVVSVEYDMSFPFLKANTYNHTTKGIVEFEVIQSATIDLVTQRRDNKDIYLWSFKTAGSYDRRTEKAASHDTQGLSETWAFEQLMRNKNLDKKVQGVQMLYFVKGKRQETEKGSGVWETRSPLIKGYRRVGIDDIEYAHSWWYPKPENKSGQGYLGKGWESFDVWENEEVGGIRGWIEMLASGQVQEECGDVLAKWLVMPEPYDRRQDTVNSWLRQTRAEERRISERLIQAGLMSQQRIDEFTILDETFPQNRQSCCYPSDCTYMEVCHGPVEIALKPLENGFDWREPHHEAERKELR